MKDSLKNKISLFKNFLLKTYPFITSIEVIEDTQYDKPLITFQYISQQPDIGNEDSWLTREIIEEAKKVFGKFILIAPYWGFHRELLKADIILSCDRITPEKKLDEGRLEPSSNTSRRIIKYLETNGVLETTKLVGSYSMLEELLGRYEIPRNLKIDAIQEWVSLQGGVGLVELDEEPIFYSKKEEEFRQIEYLGKNRVTIDVYGGSNYNSLLGDFHVAYDGLSDKIIDKIFDIVMSAIDRDVKF